MGANDELNGFQPPAALENGGWKTAEPASSILAAQLAPRLSSQGDQAHHLTRKTFAQLREELAGGIYSHLRLDDNVTDVNKLICIVLKIGLDPRFPKDEAPRDENLERQILDCLDIIQIAVEKAPQILNEISDPGLLGVDIYAPLFAWLVIRFIELLRNWHNESIGAKISITLSSIACSQIKSVKSWPSCYSVSAFLRACTSGLSRFDASRRASSWLVADILLSLEDLSLTKPRVIDESKVIIPSRKGSVLVELDRLSLPGGIFGKGFLLGTYPQAIILSLRLLDSFHPKFRYSLYSGSGDLLSNLAWILNGYQRLWRIILNCCPNPESAASESRTRVVLQFLTSLQNYCEQEPSRSGWLQSDLGFSQTWLQCLSEIFKLNDFYQQPTFQIELSSFFCGIIETSKNPDMLFGGIRYSLLPTLIDLKRDPVFQNLEPELQVSSEIHIHREIDHTNWVLEFCTWFSRKIRDREPGERPGLSNSPLWL